MAACQNDLKLQQLSSINQSKALAEAAKDGKFSEALVK
jgi:hypothetical protein